MRCAKCRSVIAETIWYASKKSMKARTPGIMGSEIDPEGDKPTSKRMISATANMKQKPANTAHVLSFCEKAETPAHNLHVKRLLTKSVNGKKRIKAESVTLLQ